MVDENVPTVKEICDAAANSSAGVSIERVGDRVVIRLEQPFAYLDIAGKRYHVADIY